jgi:hypothetical protein
MPIACIAPDGSVTCLSDDQLDTDVLLDLVHATYEHLVSIFGPDHRRSVDAPGWTILTPAGLAYVGYRGQHPGDTTPRLLANRVFPWAVSGLDYPIAAWITKVLSRPAVTAGSIV